jgi:type I restriction enzyme M protein
MSNFQEKITFIWDLADLLRGPYKRNEYQKVILPFTVLKRFDCVLSDSKANVLETYNQFKGQFENVEHVLQEASKDKNGNPLGFYNFSRYDFKTLLEDPEHIEQNLVHYIDSFSKNVQDIFGKFKLKAQIEKLAKTDRLFRLVKKFSETKVDLHPDVVSNHEMGMIFEELTRKFAEQSNEEAGDHFTPKDVVELMTKLMFVENGVHLTKKDLIKTVYDPACGTGGMLSSCKDFISKINYGVDIVLFGQEINDEIFAICKSDMLIRGEDSDKVKGGDDLSTLSKDQFPNEKFDYIISNPPYGTKWEADQDEVEKEAKKGFEGRFGAGTPRINDGQLLFLQHMISKMKLKEKSRVAVITNGSPLFTGDAGSGESDIRKWIIEGDLIEAIIALPQQMFYKTGIGTYIWILTNEKPIERVGKIQLIDATSKFKKMRKSLGSKRQYISPEDIKDILEYYETLKPSKNIKIFDNEEFGYTKVIVERPLQLNYCVNKERLENLYSYSAFSKLSESKNKNPDEKLKEEEDGKAKQDEIIKTLKSMGDKAYKNWDEFEEFVKKALKSVKLTPAFIKNIILKLSEHDAAAEYVLDAKGKKQPDSNLRDSEKIPLKEDIQKYFDREVKPYYSDAWMNRSKDKIGYELNFTQYFYKYVPPRHLEDIEADIKKVTGEIQELIREDVRE